MNPNPPMTAANNSISTSWSEALLPRLLQTATYVRTARPEISALQLMLMVILYVALTQNMSLAHAVNASLPNPFTFQEWRISASVFVTLLTILFIAFLPFSSPTVIRQAAGLFMVVAAVCSYFMDTFGVVINQSMIVNAVKTDVHEASDLMRGAFWVHVIVFGALPAALVMRVRIVPESAFNVLGRRAFWLGLALIAEAALIGSQYNELAFWGRTHRDVRMRVNPTFPIYSVYRHSRDELFASAPKVILPIAEDAKRSMYPGHKPFVMVMVIGETARAQNFQLNGYARETNPKLSQIQDLVNFTDVSSCGTATAESVPCIFSALPHEHFSRSEALGQQNILDVFTRLGVNVAWWDNNSGCQGVCERLGSVNLEAAGDPAFCDKDECHDEILLRDLDATLNAATGSTLLLLHMKGSHGPAYFKRYPKSARVFTPDCADESVQRCAPEEVMNAYDNTLVYTDTVLAGLIGKLRAAQDRVDTAAIYVSDHGESLGENGIYLHGLPYALAPKEQTHVPMMAWFSAGTQQNLGIDLACVEYRARQPASHDNLFHSLLGLFLVSTNVYEQKQDLLTGCR